MIDRLETRTLLSGSFPAELTSKGTLNITGTADADEIVVQLKNDKTSLQVILQSADRRSRVDQTFKLKNVARIHIDTAAGDDFINIAGQFQKPAVLIGGNGNDQISGGKGASVISGGQGNDYLMSENTDTYLHRTVVSDGTSYEFVVSGPAASTLEGGLGDDTLCGFSKSDNFNGGGGEDLAIDRVISQNSIEGKISTRIRKNLGDRGLQLEGYDIALKDGIFESIAELHSTIS